MTEPTPLHGGFSPSELSSLLDRACAVANLNSRGARLLRGHTNAVLLLDDAPVVVKVARRGSCLQSAQRTVAFVQWLEDQGFPTAPLHPVPRQPIEIEGHAVTFWTYLPQAGPEITAADLASPLSQLHQLPPPPMPLRNLDNLTAIRRSLGATQALPASDLDFLSRRADDLECALASVTYALPGAVLQGDPQHRNALRDRQRTVLCDWDTAAIGQPEWDLVTVEIHCRRFGHGQGHYNAFCDAYGFDVTEWPGYPVLRAIRELRMITTNARKADHAPGTLTEVRRRIKALRVEEDTLLWSIL
ncbi:aminoglycoside phosphotransferase family protein [Streptomyces sp. Edi2]|uniref:phosphotransferase family protein n=1 Tax=Streptomyces sp. Edi2 TaxID=3162528 RepID=UPI003305DDFE